MAFSLNTSNVKGPLVSAIALAPLAAAFTGGVEIGMKKPSKVSVTANVTGMSSGNGWPDSYKASIEAAALQNDFTTLAAVNTYAETGCQAMVKTADGAFGSFTGLNLEVETVVGLEWEWKFNAKDDEIIYKIMTELAKATFDAAWTESTTNTWTSGVDATKRLRPGVKKVTFGGASLGNLISVEGSLKCRPVYVQLGRPLSTGVEASIKIVLAQTDKDEVTAALAAGIGSDTVIVSFWDGVRILKLTNLLGGKVPTFEWGEKNELVIEVKAFFPKSSSRIIIDTTPGTLELVFLDNEVAS